MIRSYKDLIDGRLSRADYLRHLSIARGSLMELQTLLALAHRLYGPSVAIADTISQETAMMLNALIARLRHPKPPTPKPQPL